MKPRGRNNVSAVILTAQNLPVCQNLICKLKKCVLQMMKITDFRIIQVNLIHIAAREHVLRSRLTCASSFLDSSSKHEHQLHQPILFISHIVGNDFLHHLLMLHHRQDTVPFHSIVLLSNLQSCCPWVPPPHMFRYILLKTSCNFVLVPSLEASIRGRWRWCWVRVMSRSVNVLMRDSSDQ